jgi:serine/threonine protein kinase
MDNSRNIVNYLDYLTYQYAQWCQRSNGSFYAIADGLQCRKGKPVSRSQIKQVILAKLAERKGKADEKTGFIIPPGIKGYNIGKQIEGMSNYGNSLGYGEMASASRTSGPPPGVIKRGKIGEHEAEALGILKGKGIAPEFHAIKFGSRPRKGDPPDKKPEVGVTRLGGHVKESEGYLVMGEIKGQTAEKYLLDKTGRTEAEKQRLQTEFLKARKTINQNGIAHNDLHAGNFILREDGSVGVIDFGLSQVGYRFALIEAMGLNNGGDLPGSILYQKNYFSTENPTYQRLIQNREKVVNLLKSRYSIDWDNDNNVPKKVRSLEQQVTNSPLGTLEEKEVLELINLLYEGI